MVRYLDLQIPLQDFGMQASIVILMRISTPKLLTIKKSKIYTFGYLFKLSISIRIWYWYIFHIHSQIKIFISIGLVKLFYSTMVFLHRT
jgi:hypothetical protein